MSDSDSLELFQFMERRGLKEVIDHCRSENIDESVFLLLPEEKLSELLPKEGDRLAVLDFCHRRSKPKKKQSLIDKIREKINNKNSTKESSDVKHALEQKSATKQTRKIEIGWLDWKPSTTRYSQVRTKQGGGTRLLDVNKTTTKGELINLALELFFKGDGQSTRGHRSQFKFDLLDFEEKPIMENMTVGEMYNTTRLPKLRFYLASKLSGEIGEGHILYNALNYVINDIEISHVEVDKSLSPVEQLHSVSEPSHIIDDDYLTSDSSAIAPHRGRVSEDRSGVEQILSLRADNHESSSDSLHRQRGLGELSPSTIPNIIAVQDDSFSGTTTITLHRGRVLEEMIVAFVNNDIKKIQVEMVLPNGQIERGLDSRGVFRDSISEFWTSFYEKYTIGTRVKVPYLRHDLHYKEWVAVSRILKLGWQEEGYFPIKIAAPFLEQCFYGTFYTDVIETLFKFISTSEEEVLRRALTDLKSVNSDELIEILENFDCKWLPTQNNVYTLLYDIAHKELIQKPMFVIDTWAFQLNNLLSLSHLQKVFVNTQPTVQNILPLIKCENEHDGQTSKILKFLKKFLREADERILSSFLRFCTGSDQAINKITLNVIIKSQDSDFTRSPVAHTCGSVLELPGSYENFVEFRNEFNNLLNSQIWVMDIL